MEREAPKYGGEGASASSPGDGLHYFMRACTVTELRDGLCMSRKLAQKMKRWLKP